MKIKYKLCYNCKYEKECLPAEKVIKQGIMYVSETGMFIFHRNCSQYKKKWYKFWIK